MSKPIQRGILLKRIQDQEDEIERLWYWLGKALRALKFYGDGNFDGVKDLKLKFDNGKLARIIWAQAGKYNSDEKAEAFKNKMSESS